MFTLAHLSDLHLAPLPAPRVGELFGKRITGYINWRRRRHFIHDRSTLDRLIADLKAQGLDHVAVTGDIVNIAAEAEFPPGRAVLENLGPANAVSFVPGNHDIYTRAGARYTAHEFGAYMRGDQGDGSPYLRRRGPLALIGVSSGVPTAWGMATGRIGDTQLAGLATLLDALKREPLLRVIMVHHPPVSEAGWHKRLVDAEALKRVLAEHGAELLLHGHDHRAMLNWLGGPNGTRVPAVGVPSASAPGVAKEAAAYNLYRFDGAPGAWTCEMIARGVTAEGNVVERKREKLLG